jgi:HEAT repeats
MKKMTRTVICGGLVAALGALLPGQAPDPVTQPMADQVQRLHAEADRVRQDTAMRVEIDQAVRNAKAEVAMSIRRSVIDGVVAQIGAAAQVPMPAPVPPPPFRHDSGSSSGAYRRGLHALDERKWDEAVEHFKKTGKYRPDASLYWAAFAHYKAGRSEQALTAVGTLQNTYGSSPWMNDAKTLEVEIKAAQGKPVNPDSVNDDEIKLIAVSGLIRSDVEKGLPYLEKMVTGSQSPRVKEEALSLLARTNSPRAREMVVRVARSGNPDMQLKAIHALGHMDSKENVAMLASLYGEAKDKDVKEEIIDALHSARAAKPLVDVAKSEKDFELKKRAVRHLSRMNTKESNEYLLEMLK